MYLSVCWMMERGKRCYVDMDLWLEGRFCPEGGQIFAEGQGLENGRASEGLLFRGTFKSEAQGRWRH